MKTAKLKEQEQYGRKDMHNKIKPIEIKVYEKGVCFLCRKNTEDHEAYLHHECAIAYEDHKRIKLKEYDVCASVPQQKGG